VEHEPELVDHTAVRAARFITSNAGGPLSLADIADHVSYSPFHLARRFESYIGIPPGRYLANSRFARAKKLLLETDEPVVDICFEVGFTSLGTFSRRFAEDVGFSPGRFRVLPHILADHPPRPVYLPPRHPGGGVVTGTLELLPAAAEAVGLAPSVYVGLFATQSPRGRPAAACLLDGTDTFVFLNVPAGRYWVLAYAVPGAADPVGQLAPPHSVLGRAPGPVVITPSSAYHRVGIVLAPARDWQLPVLLAAPALASAGT
jgi:AraC-like DNA-binding protein